MLIYLIYFSTQDILDSRLLSPLTYGAAWLKSLTARKVIVIMLLEWIVYFFLLFMEADYAVFVFFLYDLLRLWTWNWTSFWINKEIKKRKGKGTELSACHLLFSRTFKFGMLRKSNKHKLLYDTIDIF